ncbi:UrcA family protein [Croceibacterium mercuriale]|uniref:UrcA family protein n=1 Tax=Croceibacterium mercuriale TaxID=1572751 RepID=UPI00068EAF28|nr:UrcA family protein [Croceibacterium mercuriale]
MPHFTTRAALTGLLALGAIATPALANEKMVVSPLAEDSRSVAVKVSDLNLTSPYDQRTLALRVNRAAFEVCDMERGSVLNRTPSALNCFDSARSGALAQLDARGYAASAAVAAAGGSI